MSSPFRPLTWELELFPSGIQLYVYEEEEQNSPDKTHCDPTIYEIFEWATHVGIIWIRSKAWRMDLESFNFQCTKFLSRRCMLSMSASTSWMRCHSSRRVEPEALNYLSPYHENVRMFEGIKEDFTHNPSNAQSVNAAVLQKFDG